MNGVGAIRACSRTYVVLVPTGCLLPIPRSSSSPSTLVCASQAVQCDQASGARETCKECKGPTSSSGQCASACLSDSCSMILIHSFPTDYTAHQNRYSAQGSLKIAWFWVPQLQQLPACLPSGCPTNPLTQCVLGFLSSRVCPALAALFPTHPLTETQRAPVAPPASHFNSTSCHRFAPRGRANKICQNLYQETHTNLHTANWLSRTTSCCCSSCCWPMPWPTSALTWSPAASPATLEHWTQALPPLTLLPPGLKPSTSFHT